MKIILFGATGMVGQGALRECLLDPDVEAVLTVGRSTTGQQHAKLRELAHRDLTDFSSVEKELTGYDACFFCLGVTSSGMSEADYTRVTHDIAVAAGRTLVRLNPQLTFVFVSGLGTDSTEKGKTMWARVKGRAENALLAMSFKRAYMFRPGFIEPLHGITSKTRSYRVLYAMMRPFMPLLRPMLRSQMTTTERIGRAMLAAVRKGGPSGIVDIAQINALAAG